VQSCTTDDVPNQLHFMRQQQASKQGTTFKAVAPFGTEPRSRLSTNKCIPVGATPTSNTTDTSHLVHVIGKD